MMIGTERNLCIKKYRVCNSEDKVELSMKYTHNFVTIGERKIGKGQKSFTIAEMSGNHNQSLSRALEIVHAAAKSGADAVKLQTYTADTLTLKKNDGEFFINDPSSLWLGQSMYDLYQKAYTPWEWQDTIFNECKNSL